MKLYSTLLALFMLETTLSSSFAFQVPKEISSPLTTLSSSSTYVGTDYGYPRTNTRGGYGYGYGYGGGYGGTRRGRFNRIEEVVPPFKVQGGSLKTWSYDSYYVEKVQVVLRTEGRPLDADVELWQGPDNCPIKMRIYVEDGSKRAFNTVIGTPRGPNTIAIRNIGHQEFPLDAYVTADTIDGPTDVNWASDASIPRTIQGGALRTYPFEPIVEEVQVLLHTDGRPLNARIELLQGPNNRKEVIELYTEDGMDRPFFLVIDTPGAGNVVRIVNTAPVEFPLTSWVEAYSIGDGASARAPVMGGDREW